MHVAGPIATWALSLGYRKAHNITKCTISKKSSIIIILSFFFGSVTKTVTVLLHVYVCMYGTNTGWVMLKWNLYEHLKVRIAANIIVGNIEVLQDKVLILQSKLAVIFDWQWLETIQALGNRTLCFKLFTLMSLKSFISICRFAHFTTVWRSSYADNSKK